MAKSGSQTNEDPPSFESVCTPGADAECICSCTAFARDNCIKSCVKMKQYKQWHLKRILERLFTAYCTCPLARTSKTSSLSGKQNWPCIFMHFLSMFIYVSFRTARHFPVIVTHFGSQHFPCMLSSLSKPASLMQPASRSAMARIEPEGSEGKSISLSSSGWKETNKESVIWTV